MRRLVRQLTTILAIAAAVLLPESVEGAEQSVDGFLWGTVETRSGTTYRGFIRWDDEEAFWDDHFNSGKGESEYTRYLSREEVRRERAIEIFGFTIGWEWNDDDVSRQFVARFGDIERLEPRGGRSARVTMKSGTVYDVSGVANDVGATIRVRDDVIGEIELDWDAVERVEFAPAPKDATPPATRIYGVVETDDGVFEGYIQWDSQECLSTDLLDGETRDGDVSIEMGKIRSIEKRNRRGAWVELADGRRLLLEDTNDVDDSIRGILVETTDYRVEIDWDAFRRVDFKEVPSSGRSYKAYRPGKELRGRVETRDGDRLEGRLVFDLDEAETWEFLNGDRYGIEYSIPFFAVRRIEPLDRDSSRVTLVGGETLELEDSADVGEGNAGILVFVEDRRDPRYVRWDEVEVVELR